MNKIADVFSRANDVLVTNWESTVSTAGHDRYQNRDKATPTIEPHLYGMFTNVIFVMVN